MTIPSRRLLALAIFAASIAAAPATAPAQPVAPFDPVTFCSWTGSDPEEYCRKVDIIGKNTDPIPAELGNLTNLVGLQLEGNFTGPIPAELGNLTNLVDLQLRGNFTGPIPAELGNLTNLTRLHLDDLGGYSTIPAELGNFTNLVDLQLRGFTGPIPAELGNLTNLINLDLSYNKLTGPIPAELLGNLTSLSSLRLNNNQLTGPIPAELGNLTNLINLDLDNNQLTGPIPAELLGNLTSLRSLSLNNNKLTGPIPAELGNFTDLIELQIADNKLTGPIPAELGNLNYPEPVTVRSGGSKDRLIMSLDWLNLACNKLTGPIPAELGNLTSLSRLSLSYNQLTGPIPAELGNLTSLSSLRLDNNQLTGPIPAELKPASRPEVSCLSFYDDDDSVHEANIQFIAWRGITKGCGERRFCPSRTVTRAQMAAFLNRSDTLGISSWTPPPLSDVPDDAWYRIDASWAVFAGVMRAPDGNFDPGGAVTRADMAEMLVAAFAHLSAPAQARGVFTDTAGLTDDAVRAIEGIAAAEVTTGCAADPPRYCPDKTVTRAQMASFLARAIQSAPGGR